ncbi:MAG: DNA-processing protein DprA [Candidatus Omnitrophica bacterium]|nr:DNA-processing protein DprA [Candidatus Omnitrophota bacterium]
MEDKVYWIALNLIGISWPKIKKFIEMEGIKELFNLRIEELLSLGISKNLAEKIVKWEELPIKEEIEYIKKEGINILTIDDPLYPYLLKEIFDPPILLYVKGNVNLNQISISIVGTRNPSIYGLKMAEKFASELASLGFIIVSGLARGIDTACHTGALRVGGKTVGVLGSGFKNFYPPENKKIENEIIKNGAIITEFPSNTLPTKYNFPKRNRIISGLSKGVIVIEAGPKSGALITANFALEQGRDVFALPGRIDTLYSKGTNKLLKEGAILVENIEDILTSLNIKFEKKEKKEIEVETEIEKKILSLLEQPLQLEEILIKTGISTSLLFSFLTKLQIKGIIEELPGKIYRKK